jgi:polysaccharide biosynthesis protein PslG
MTHTKFTLHQLFLTILGMLFLGCTPQAPIPVYITPTPEIPTLTATTVPTLDSPATDETMPAGTPRMIGAVVQPDYTLQPSDTPIPSETATLTLEATATNTVSGVTGTPRSLGAIVGPEYTLPPSETPRATSTPSLTPPQRPTTGPSPTPLPGLDPSLMGVQVYTNLGREEWDFFLQRAKELGVGWIKVQTSWAFLQPNGANPDEQVLRTFELNLQTADQMGFKILLSVAKAPAWARSSNDEAAPPNNPQALAEFFTLMFNNTKIGEIADAIEIWNEPNLRREWSTDALPFSGAGYMQLFGPSYQAIRAYRSDMVIVTAGLAPAATIAGAAVDDRVYLQQMYDAGLRNYPDIAIGVHPYGWGNAPDAVCCDSIADRGWDDNPHFFFIETLNATRDIMNRNGHQNVPMWVTEFGWATWEGFDVPLPAPAENNLWMRYNSAADQANYAIRAFEIGQKERNDIGVMFLWNLNFANPFTIQNSQEIVGYSILLPPTEDDPDNIVRRPLAWLLPVAISQSNQP